MPRETKHSEAQKIPKLRFPGFSGEWKEKKLGDVATFLKGTGISKADVIKDGKNKCIRYGELYTTYKELIRVIVSKTNTPKEGARLSKDNDVLMPTSDVTPAGLATASALNEPGVILGGDILIIRSNVLSNLFFSYYIAANKKDVMRLVNGVTVYHLYGSDMATMKVRVTTFLEQQKIADFLGLIDEWIENLRVQKEALGAYKKGMMQKIFSQEIRFKDDKENSFPDWEERKFGKIVTFFTAPHVEVNKNQSDGLWFIDMGSVSPDGSLQLKKHIHPTTNVLKKNDLVMPNRDIGHGDIIGKVAIIDSDDKYVLGNNMYGVTAAKGFVPKFLYYRVNSSQVNKVMRTRANGTSQLQLIRKDVDSVKIFFPSFLEQQKIADFLTSLDDLIESKQQQIIKAEGWKKGLMQELFV